MKNTGGPSCFFDGPHRKGVLTGETGEMGTKGNLNHAARKEIWKETGCSPNTKIKMNRL